MHPFPEPDQLREVVSMLVLDLAVPLLLLAGLVASWLAACRVAPGARLAAYAGSWAGLVCAAGYAVLVAHASVTLPATAGLIGLVAGVAAPTLFFALRRGRAVGLLCLAQAFGAAASLLNHFTVPGLASFTAVLTLSDAFGLCLVVLAWPSIERRLRRPPGRTP